MIFGKGRVPFEKKKKKRKEREEFGCTDVRTVWEEYLFFSVLNEDVDRKDSDTR